MGNPAYCRPLTPLPATGRLLRLSKPFPEAGLFVEAVELGAAEVEARDDAHNLLVIDDRQVPIAVVFHQPQGFDRQLARAASYGVRAS